LKGKYAESPGEAFSADRKGEPAPLGVIHGRFQVLHVDHMKYLLAGKARCRHLVVGITNPDPTLTRSESADPDRDDPLSNPLTYFERLVMTRTALVASGVPLEEFSIVPFPINFPELYKYYVPLGARFFLTIYDDWGRRKLQRFQDLGLDVEVLWERDSLHKGISASEVRRRMLAGEPWESLTAPGVAPLLEQWELPARLRAVLAGQ